MKTINKYALFVLVSITCSVYCQPINKIENSELQEIEYVVSSKRSKIKIVNASEFAKIFCDNIKSSNLIKLVEERDFTYISSLHVFSFKNGQIRYSPCIEEFEPNKITSDFISKNIFFKNFSGLTDKSRLGLYFSYNLTTRTIIIELCEIKEDKYFLIFRYENTLRN